MSEKKIASGIMEHTHLPVEPEQNDEYVKPEPLSTDPTNIEVTHPELKRWMKAAVNEDGTVDHMEMRLINDAQAIMNIMNNQGHSGFSANYFINRITRLLKLGVIFAIEDTPEDWEDISRCYDGSELKDTDSVWQHKRMSSIFKDRNGRCLCLDNNYYEIKDEHGLYCTANRSFEITFPYMPQMPEYIKLNDPRHPDYINESNNHE